MYIHVYNIAVLICNLSTIRSCWAPVRRRNISSSVMTINRDGPIGIPWDPEWEVATYLSLCICVYGRVPPSHGRANTTPILYTILRVHIIRDNHSQYKLLEQPWRQSCRVSRAQICRRPGNVEEVGHGWPLLIIATFQLHSLTLAWLTYVVYCILIVGSLSSFA